MDFEFNKLPTELLVVIFHHARASSVHDAYEETYTYPVALSHVCRYRRTVALSAPTLWANIRILEYHAERSRDDARIYLERSKVCPHLPHLVYGVRATPHRCSRCYRGHDHPRSRALAENHANRWKQVNLRRLVHHDGTPRLPNPPRHRGFPRTVHADIFTQTDLVS